MRRIDLKKVNAARSNTIRDINRQIVLNYVRELGPISRAEIARETALQRSTISLIVDELRVDGLIEEVSGESTGGRPPSLLSLRTVDAVAIGVDLGGTTLAGGLVDAGGEVLAHLQEPTHGRGPGTAPSCATAQCAPLIAPYYAAAQNRDELAPSRYQRSPCFLPKE